MLLLARFRYRQVKGLLFCFYVAAISAAMMFVICVGSGQLSLPRSLLGWGLCLLFATSVTTGAVVLFQEGSLLIGGEKASVLSALEPITGVVIGILPTTGLPLPFFSAGGTSISITMAAVGILMNISRTAGRMET